MPLYDYFCSACQESWEDRNKIDDRNFPETLPCPKCNAVNSVKLCCGAPAIGDPIRLGIRKHTGEFKELMGGIKRSYHRNTLKDFK